MDIIEVSRLRYLRYHATLASCIFSSPGAPHSHRYPDTPIPLSITFITSPCHLHFLAPQELLPPPSDTPILRYSDTLIPTIPPIPPLPCYPYQLHTLVPRYHQYHRYRGYRRYHATLVNCITIPLIPPIPLIPLIPTIPPIPLLPCYPCQL